ncbi:MAG: type IV pilus secretin PilQ, partial [Elusimicrobiota bacterium]
APANAPAPEAPRATALAAAAQAAAELPRTMTTNASPELERIAMSKDAHMRAAPAPPPLSRARIAPKKEPGSKPRRDILATLPADPITLDFDSMDIRDILKLMATKAKINVVYGQDVSGAMSLHLRDVPFSEAFMTILSMQGLVASQVGENILRVMTPGTMATERSVAVTHTRVIKIKYNKAQDIFKALSAVLQAQKRTGVLVVDEPTNSVIVTDTLEGIAAAERLLAEIDVRPQQVLIETKLVEVKLTKDLHFGIQWDYFSVDQSRHGGQIGMDTVGAAPFPPSTVSKPFDTGFKYPALEEGLVGGTGRGTGVFLPASKVFGALTLGRVTNNYFLSATLTAAASEGKVKVLSDPKITTLNGKKASIDITTQIPYVTSNVSSTGVATETVTYINTGIQMEVTPTINADGRITLEVQPTVSQPSTVAASAGTTGAPAVDKRTANTTVMVQDGETIVIGGLITDTVTDQIAKIPLLGDIPLIGWLFKKKIKDRTRVELLIFVTTKLIAT